MMKIFKYAFSLCLFTLMVISCAEDENIDYVDAIAPPTNVSAAVSITQDNTGLVTITPLAQGAVSYAVNFGDGSDLAEDITPGNGVEHIYEEGTYEATIIATSLNGLTASATQSVVVSFKAPENLVVTIENDLAVSKQVNVTATADYAAMFEVDFGDDSEVVQANIGEVASHVYENAGTYTITVTAMGAAIETTSYTEEFEVTAILQPLASAPTPPNRSASDVISIFSSAYSNVANTDYFPDWAQGSQGSSWAMFNLNGDEMLQYINLSYQGIQFGSAQDVSGMEYIHFDVWTADVARIETSLISLTNGEKPVWTDLVADSWTRVDIPISAFTDQGLTVADIHQLKFVGDPWAGGTVFIDNVYFYKQSADTSGGVTPLTFETEFTLDAFDGGGTAVVANPDTNGNTSSSVLELVKGSGQPWAGSKITIPTPFDFSNGAVVTAKVWSPRAGLNLLMKFEDDVPWPDVTGTAEITATTTVANGWETLTFDFTGLDTNINWYNLVMIMDNGTQGDGSSNYTIYVDDISTSPILDFEPAFSLDAFDGGATSVVANPDTNGNNSASVLQLVKGSGQPWAGSKITVPTPFVFSNGTTVTAKVWSPRAGLNLLMKFEDAVPWPDVTGTAEITATTTVANGWETLTFNFTGIDMGIDWYNLVMIIDNGTQGDGSANYTIYVDDIDIN